MRVRSLWRLAVVAFYAAFAVCYCREHHADAIALQLTSAVWHPFKVRAVESATAAATGYRWHACVFLQ